MADKFERTLLSFKVPNGNSVILRSRGNLFPLEDLVMRFSNGGNLHVWVKGESGDGSFMATEGSGEDWIISSDKSSDLIFFVNHSTREKF